MAAQEEDRDTSALGYPIIVGEDLSDEIAAYVRRRGSPCLMLCDGELNVARMARRIAVAAGCKRTLTFRLGESRKRMTTLEGVLDAIHEADAERGTLVIGVGGGVASDLFGLAAATYMRGVAYAHVATSLVAMIDAAIGGKTGVNLRGGKNLVGAFRDPVAVFCDVAALRTLPDRAMREGLAEMVKAGVIEGGDFFENLEMLSPHPLARWPWVDVIRDAIEVKAAAVAQDPFESGPRARLNLGHTFAHAIERASRYRVTHGAAVAVGLRAAGELALRTGRFSEREHLRVLALLALFGLPLQTSVEPAAIFAAMRGDKKRRDGQLRFVLPRAIGDVEYGVECKDRSVRAVLARLNRPPEAHRTRHSDRSR